MMRFWFVMVFVLSGACDALTTTTVDPQCYQICVGNNLASPEECQRRCQDRSSAGCDAAVLLTP